MCIYLTQTKKILYQLGIEIQKDILSTSTNKNTLHKVINE